MRRCKRADSPGQVRRSARRGVRDQAAGLRQRRERGGTERRRTLMDILLHELAMQSAGAEAAHRRQFQRCIAALPGDAVRAGDRAPKHPARSASGRFAQQFSIYDHFDRYAGIPKQSIAWEGNPPPCKGGRSVDTEPRADVLATNDVPDVRSEAPSECFPCRGRGVLSYLSEAGWDNTTCPMCSGSGVTPAPSHRRPAGRLQRPARDHGPAGVAAFPGLFGALGPRPFHAGMQPVAERPAYNGQHPVQAGQGVAPTEVGEAAAGGDGT